MDAIVAALVPRAAARALAAFALAFAFAAPAHAASRFIPVKVAGHALRVEVAATVEQRMQGLMFRTKLGADDGMLFVFDEPGYHSMWMKNTPLPLSVAFVDGEGRILNILDMEPQTLDSHYAAGPARFAIETHKGWFAKRGINAGDKVTGLPKAK